MLRTCSLATFIRLGYETICGNDKAKRDQVMFSEYNNNAMPVFYDSGPGSKSE